MTRQMQAVSVCLSSRWERSGRRNNRQIVQAVMSYGSCMNTDHFVATLKLAQEARGAAQRRRKRNAELRELASASTIVFTGLLLAVLYALLTHQIPA